jgi:hypothetical protein
MSQALQRFARARATRPITSVPRVLQGAKRTVISSPRPMPANLRRISLRFRGASDLVCCRMPSPCPGPALHPSQMHREWQDAWRSVRRRQTRGSGGLASRNFGHSDRRSRAQFWRECRADKAAHEAFTLHVEQIVRRISGQSAVVSPQDVLTLGAATSMRNRDGAGFARRSFVQGRRHAVQPPRRQARFPLVAPNMQVSSASPWPSRAAYVTAAVFHGASGAINLTYGWAKGSDIPNSLTWAAVSVAVAITFALAWPALIRSVTPSAGQPPLSRWRRWSWPGATRSRRHSEALPGVATTQRASSNRRLKPRSARKPPTMTPGRLSLIWRPRASAK